jgi:hypothetical protein
MKKQIHYLALFLILLFPFKGQATHIVGGELTYRTLGNHQYEITLTVYRDCLHGVPPFDFPASIGIFDTANQLVNIPYHWTGYWPQGTTNFFNDSLINNNMYGMLVMPNDSETVPNVINAPCVIPPLNICYRVCHYIDTVTLPYIPGGYQLVYMICCRNNTIQNIVNPGGTGTTFMTIIPDSTIVTVNSNPVFQNLPPTFICTGIPFSFDHSATDADGDSLVYRLCAPVNCGMCTVNSQPQPPYAPPYLPITWQTPYSLANLLGGVPLAINPNTGLLTCTPNTVGQFVYGVCVAEYRNGSFIDSVRRDYQVNIVNCQMMVVSSIISPAVVCGGGYTVNFQNGSIGGTSYHWDFGVTSLTNDTSNLVSPSYTYPDTGTYLVTLITYSDSSGCNDTSTQTIRVTNFSLPTVTLNLNPDSVCINMPPYALIGGSPVGGTFFGSGVAGGNFDASIAGSGIDTIKYVYTDVNGCTDSAKEAIIVNPCTGLEQIINDDGVIIYPSPFNNSITITLSNSNHNELMSVSLNDILGQELYYNQFSSNKMVIDTKLLQKGIYFLQLKTDKGIITKKILKEN